jgi:sarcosine oxidase subunit gamma
VVKLVARSALQGEALGAVGGVVLSEADVAGAWSIAPFLGQTEAVDAALRALGLGFPAPGQVIAAGQARALWTGRGRALVEGVEIPPGIETLAAVTAQGDGIAALVISGPDAEAVLARLVPMDLRARAFPEGATARTMVNHMAAQVTRVGAQAFEVMVMRSMGHTLIHELREAAVMVAARG